MNLKFVDQLDNAGVTTQTNKFPSMNIGGILVVHSGVTATAGVTADDLPDILVKLNGKTIVSANASVLIHLADLLRGYPIQSSTTTAFEYAYLIPFFHPRLLNAINLGVGDELFLQVGSQSAHSGGTLTSSTVKIYAMGVRQAEAYIPVISSQDFTLASGNVKFTIPQNNLAFVLLEAATTTDPTNIRLDVDDDKIEGDWGTLEALTNLVMKRESSALDVVALDRFSGNIADVLSDSVSLVTTGGAGTMTTLTMNVEFDRARLVKSQVKLNTEVRKIIEKKQGTSDADVLREIAPVGR